MIKHAPKKTSHHLIPGSRCAELGIVDKDDPRNIKLILDEAHRAWHALFFNFSPYEVVQILYALHQEGFCWMMKKREWGILFGSMNLLEACEDVIRNWTPPQSFYRSNLVSNVQFDAFIAPLVKRYL